MGDGRGSFMKRTINIALLVLSRGMMSFCVVKEEGGGDGYF